MKLPRRIRFILVSTTVLTLLAGCAAAAEPGAPPAPTAAPATPVPATEVVSPTATTPPPAAPADQAVVTVTFEEESVAIGDAVEAVICVAGVEDLFGLEVHVAYDAERLEMVDGDAEQEGIQAWHGDLLEIEYVLVNAGNPEMGTLDYAVAQKADAAGVGGDGALVRVAFKALADGLAELRLISVILADTQGQAIPVSFPTTGVTLEIAGSDGQAEPWEDDPNWYPECACDE